MDVREIWVFFGNWFYLIMIFVVEMNVYVCRKGELVRKENKFIWYVL